MCQQEVTMDFFPTIEVSAHEAEAIARGLYTIAAVDGVHERELALISEFSRGALDDDLVVGQAALSGGAFGRIVPLEPGSVALLLRSAPLRELFMKAALLVAWADGSVSGAERAKIAEFATALGVAGPALTALEVEVKDYLLRSLAHLNNVEAVAKVAKKLGA
jgi:tellurite resistance protein